MVFKRSLTVALVTSLAFEAALPSFAFAQNQPSSSGSISVSNPDDPIQLILRAMKTSSPDEARNLLERAKTKVADERLPQTSQRVIGEMIARATAKLQVAPKPNNLQSTTSFTIAETEPQKPVVPVTPAPVTPAPVSASADDTAMQKLLLENPDLRETMREIGRGRLSRDASDLPQIILERTNKTLEQHDQEDAANMLALTDIGAFVTALRAAGLIKDYSAQNKALREKYDTVPLETLARHIVKDAAQWSVGVGALKEILVSNGISTKRELAGVSIEALGTFLINANLILRLSDLYGVNLSSNQQEVLILFALMCGKIAMYYANDASIVQKITESVGGLFAKASLSKAPGALGRLVTKVLGIPAFKTVAQALPVGAPVSPGAAIASGAESAGVQTSDWKMRSLKIMKGMVLSGAETYFVGRVSIWFLTRTRDQERELSNESFRNYLMSAKGEGFMKLLVLAMNTGMKVPNVVDIKATKDSKANFILNLARSTRVCSPKDNMRFAQLTKMGQKSGLNSRTVQAKQLVDRDYKILRFACDTNLSSGRFDRMSREFMTFDEIPQDLIATLRVASYENRLRMGEVLLQLQFLDGDQDPKEMQFFDSTIGKILGFERLDDSKYFDRMHAFIREQGGMMVNPASPTGYSIGSKKVANPYDLAVGYTAAGGPDSPRTTVPVVPPVSSNLNNGIAAAPPIQQPAPAPAPAPAGPIIVMPKTN